MKPDTLDDLLIAYAQQPVPATSLRTSDAWREIERRRRQNVWSRLFLILDWHELFAEPRLALAALAFALMIGAVPAMAMARAEHADHLARQSIHFEVFSATSSGQLAVLLPPLSAAGRQP